MQIPSYGATPISATFLLVRLLQVISMIIVLGLAANFVNQMVMDDFEPSREIVGTLTITSLVTLYTIVSVAFYWSVANIGMFVMGGVDMLITIAWVVIAVCVGRPVSHLNCYHPGRTKDGQILLDLIENFNKPGSTLTLLNWSGLNTSNCFQTKTIWGFSIALA